jgi:hypothetical protein
MGKVTGNNPSAIGVVGDASGPLDNGVFGQAEYLGVFRLALGRNEGFGVFGEGVVGVLGRGYDVGVHGIGEKSAGIVGEGAPAGHFIGDVVIHGALTVTGAKSAASPHPDGSLRRLYALESPESWFEDFGRARLVRGRATVRLEPNWAALIRKGDYHVFVTPEGDCSGLAVVRRSSKAFTVHELAGGRSNVSFSYRIVAKRKDIAGKRLENVKLPKPPSRKPRARLCATVEHSSMAWVWLAIRRVHPMLSDDRCSASSILSNVSSIPCCGPSRSASRAAPPYLGRGEPIQSGKSDTLRSTLRRQSWGSARSKTPFSCTLDIRSMVSAYNIRGRSSAPPIHKSVSGGPTFFSRRTTNSARSRLIPDCQLPSLSRPTPCARRPKLATTFSSTHPFI